MPFWPSMNRTPLPAICRCRRIYPQPNELHEEERHKIDIRRCKGKELVQIKGGKRFIADGGVDYLPAATCTTRFRHRRVCLTSPWVEAWPREPKRGGGRKEERERETLGKKIGERGIFEAANFTSCLKAAAAGEIASTDHKLEQALVEPRSSSRRRRLSIWPSAGKGDSHYLPRSSRADVIRKPP